MTHQTYHPAERVGIWLDHQVAYFITVSSEHSPIVETIESNIRSRTAHSENEKPAIRSDHSVINNHDKLQQHQLHDHHVFYGQLIHKLREVDHVYLFGPGEAKHGLKRAIAGEGLHFRCKVTDIETSDKLTKNQMQQQVIKYFTSLKYEDSVRNLSDQGKHSSKY